MKPKRLRHPGSLHPCPVRTCRRSHGYALLLTLVMLALTAVTIGTLAHTSGAEALRARQAERDLQARWAEASARRVLLPVLQEQLKTALDQWRIEEQGPLVSPPSSVVVSIEIQGVRLLARLEDQQSLPNLNQLLAGAENGQTRDVQRVLAESAIRERLVPRPMDQDVARRLGAAPYVSWGQLYPTATPGDFSGLAPSALPPRGLVFGNAESTAAHFRGRGLPGVGVTLWGDGTLNIWTASPESLHRVLDDPIGPDQVAKLIDLRRDHRDLSARQLVQMMNLGPSERAWARLALTDRSEAYAMWLVVTPTLDGEPRPGGRAHWSLTVREDHQGNSGGRDQVFRW